MDLVPVRCHIPYLLHKIGKDQRWLAQQTGISEQRISDYVNLRYKDMRYKKMLLIATAIGCRTEELFDWEWRQQKK